MLGPNRTSSRSSAPTGTRPDRGSPRATTLAIVDLGALATFVVLGLRTHGTSTVVAAAARIVVPMGLAWFGASRLFGTYRRRDLRSLALTWALAVPAALLARAWWAGSPEGGRLVVFLAVGLAFTLLFLLAGRAAVSVAVRSRPARRRDG